MLVMFSYHTDITQCDTKIGRYCRENQKVIPWRKEVITGVFDHGGDNYHG